MTNEWTCDSTKIDVIAERLEGRIAELRIWQGAQMGLKNPLKSTCVMYGSSAIEQSAHRMFDHQLARRSFDEQPARSPVRYAHFCLTGNRLILPFHS